MVLDCVSDVSNLLVKALKCVVGNLLSQQPMFFKMFDHQAATAR